MHPAEFLNGREPARGAPLVHAAVRIRKVDAVLNWPEAVAVGFFVFEGEADEVSWRLPDLPVHGEERHAVATVQLQREESVGVLRDNLKIAEHTRTRLRMVDRIGISQDIREFNLRRSNNS